MKSLTCSQTLLAFAAVAILAAATVPACGGVSLETLEEDLGISEQAASLDLYSTNLVTNPSGDSGLSGWTLTTGADGWWAAADEGGNNSFFTSWKWSSRTQEIDLYAKGFDAATMAKSPPIYVGELVRRRYCSDQYEIKVELL